MRPSAETRFSSSVRQRMSASVWCCSVMFWTWPSSRLGCPSMSISGCIHSRRCCEGSLPRVSSSSRFAARPSRHNRRQAARRAPRERGCNCLSQRRWPGTAPCSSASSERSSGDHQK
ncbi:hypothetical protein G6F24_017511 [Rhizopus arrhizus]|nr:hypothetical protein G6F24_017511 [Rhizopus arrhizus]